MLLSLRRDLLVAMLTAAATALGTKLVEFGFEAWKDRKKETEKSPIILPSGNESCKK